MANKKQKELKQALELLKEQENILRSAGSLEGVADCLHKQSIVLVELNELEKALLLRQEIEQTYRSLGKKEKVVAALAGQSIVFELKGMISEALMKNQEAQDLARNEGLTSMLPMIVQQEKDLKRSLHQQIDPIGNFEGRKKVYHVDLGGNEGNLRPFQIATGLIELGISFIIAAIIDRQLANAVPLIWIFSLLAFSIGVVFYVAAAIFRRYWPETDGIKDFVWLLGIGSFWGGLVGIILLILPETMSIFIFVGYLTIFLIRMFRQS